MESAKHSQDHLTLVATMVAIGAVSGLGDAWLTPMITFPRGTYVWAKEMALIALTMTAAALAWPRTRDVGRDLAIGVGLLGFGALSLNGVFAVFARHDLDDRPWLVIVLLAALGTAGTSGLRSSWNSRGRGKAGDAGVTALVIGTMWLMACLVLASWSA